MSALHSDFKYTDPSMEISHIFLKFMHFIHKIKVLIIDYLVSECPKIPKAMFGHLVDLRYLEIQNSNKRVPNL